MRYVVQHVPGTRERTMEHILRNLPTAEVVECRGNPIDTFYRTLIPQPHWHMEDDVILATDFLDRAKELVRQRSQQIIQVFSLTERSGDQAASTFCGTLCVWLPAGYGPRIQDYVSRHFDKETLKTLGFDTAIKRWMIANRMRYWLESPSLVQHDEVKSLRGPRSTKRTSPTFSEFYGEPVLW